MMQRSKVEMKLSPSRRQQANVTVEIMTRLVENCLRFFFLYPRDDYDKLLPAAELPCSTCISDDLDVALWH